MVKIIRKIKSKKQQKKLEELKKELETYFYDKYMEYYNIRKVILIVVNKLNILSYDEYGYIYFQVEEFEKIEKIFNEAKDEYLNKEYEYVIVHRYIDEVVTRYTEHTLEYIREDFKEYLSKKGKLDFLKKYKSFSKKLFDSVVLDLIEELYESLRW